MPVRPAFLCVKIVVIGCAHFLALRPASGRGALLMSGWVVGCRRGMPAPRLAKVGEAGMPLDGSCRGVTGTAQAGFLLSCRP